MAKYPSAPPPMGDKAFSKRVGGKPDKQVSKSKQPADQKAKMGAKAVFHGTGKPEGKKGIAKSVAKRDCR